MAVSGQFARMELPVQKDVAASLTGNVVTVSDTVHAATISAMSDRLASLGFAVIQGGSTARGVAAPVEDIVPAQLLSAATVLVCTPRHLLTSNTLARAQNLQCVCVPVIGTENIDIAAATKAGVLVSNTPTEETTTGMAEAYVALLLSLLYRLDVAQERLRSGGPRPPSARQLMGKTIGLIGFGRIAQAIAARLSPWGVTMLATTRSPPSAVPVDHVHFVPLEELLARSDAVLVVTALRSDNQSMIGTRQFAAMKSGALFINAARGKLVDEPALIEALTSGHLGGAALDVFDTEPLPEESPLRTIPNVVLTPHVVGVTGEALSSRREALFENVRRVLTAGMPLHCLNPEAMAFRRSRGEQPADDL